MTQNSIAQSETASPNNISQIYNWVKDGVTQKIIFPAGTYNFPTPLITENDDLILEGSGINSTYLVLTDIKNSLIDAKGNNYHITNLTLDGGKNQKSYANPIFRFHKSKGHYFENVEFTNSTMMGVASIGAYPTHGLTLKNCVFSNIDLMPVQIFNRNTNNRNGEVIEVVEQVLIDGCTFKEGYQTGVSSDNGNDREDSGDGTGRRYTESTSLSETIIQNCMFEKSTQFHIAMVQSKDLIIKNNTFLGMTDDAGGGCQPIHMEQFTQNIKIYNNTFFMPNTVSQNYYYIHINGTEGHKRVTQQQPSSTSAIWTYNVYGGNERRADTSCAKSGNTNKDCKRDVHSYGARNIYIAGNTFNDSSKISSYIAINEGENIRVGQKSNGDHLLNNFIGNNSSSKKISFGGNDEGTCDVIIYEGQNIAENNVEIKDVNFDLPACKLTKPIIIGAVASVGEAYSSKEGLFKFYPNPIEDKLCIKTEITEPYTIIISDLNGNILKIKEAKKPSIIINVKNLISGNYILSMETQNGKKASEKIILQ